MSENTDPDGADDPDSLPPEQDTEQLEYKSLAEPPAGAISGDNDPDAGGDA